MAASRRATGVPTHMRLKAKPTPYFALITSFAIDFEKTYIRWLYEALAMVEQDQKED